jgi:opacity protein-like surface antigen
VKKIVQVAAFLCLAAALPAHAQMYWRLEFGLSQANDAEFKDKNPDFAQIIKADFSTDVLNNIDESYILGAGIGYRFSSSLRGDVTLTYRGGYRLDDRDQDGGFTPPLPASYSADITSTAIMVNGYYDFSAGGVRPYLGAGVGLSRNHMGPLVQDWGRGFQLAFGAGTTTEAAFAVMAGVGIPLSGRILDIGYRYVDLGKIETGTGLYINGALVPDFGFGPYPGASGKLTAHELTLGIRF